ESEFRSSWLAVGRCADGLCSLDALPPSQSAKSEMGKPRSIPVIRRPWIDAALFVALPNGLWPADGGTTKVSPVRFKNPRSPGVWLNAGRRNNHWPAGPGVCERSWNGDGCSSPRCNIQQAEQRSHKSLRLRDCL